ncbi:MAG: alpha/beta fold hydrolase [Rubrivivax sp.]
MQLQANGITLEVEVDGPADGRPLLLIMGLGMQLTAWPRALVDDLVARGFRVVRLDNRDAGLSQGFEALGVPNLAWASVRHWLRLPVRAPYALAELAADSIGVLDALGITQADVCGVSMGGMVAQHLAATWPQRVRALTLVMTTSGARRLPGPRPAVQRALLARPRGKGPEAIVDHLVQLFGLIGSPGYPPEPAALRRELQASVARAWRPTGTARQLVAIVADADRTPLLRRVSAPAAIVHGADDPLVPVAAAHDLARSLRAATVDIVPGMGHDLPRPLLPRIADAIEQVARRAPA